MPGYKPEKLAYDKVEPDGGPDDSLSPIIFHHGLTGDKGHWKDLINEVANATKRTAYALDARNHGDSEWSDEFSFDIVAEDLLNFMDTLDIPKAILVGHSMGGYASMKAALKKPERIEKLIVEDMVVKQISEEIGRPIAFFVALSLKAAEATTAEMDEEEAKTFMANYMCSNMPEEVKAIGGPLFTPEGFKKAINIKQKVDGGWMYKSNLEVILKTMNAGKLYTEELEGTYEGPTSFIYGTQSPLNVRSEEEEIRALFPNVEFIPIEAAHEMHLGDPKEFTKQLLKVLAADP